MDASVKTKNNVFLGLIEYFFACIFRGISFVFKELPSFLWKGSSKAVDQAYKGATKGAGGGEVAGDQKSLFKMDLSDLYTNSKAYQQKIASLEKEKINLFQELEGTGKIRSKDPVVYRFTARKDGKITSGIMSGLSKLDIHTFLVQDGYEVFKIENDALTQKMYGSNGLFTPKLKTKDLLFWLTQLSTYLKAGISLTDSIKILNQQMGKNKNYKRAFQAIVYELTMGEAFSTALEKQGTMFPALLINMLKAAEKTGELEETLDDMAEYYTEIDKTRKQMVSAMTYPTVIMVFSLAVVTFIMVYVIPQFVQIYNTAGAEVAGITLMVLNISEFLKANLLTLLGVLIAVILGITFAYRNVKAFRKAMQIFLMKMPIIGKIILYNEMTIFSKTFSSLLRNNVFITDSIDILSKITNNEVYKEIMYNTIDNIVKGDRISKAFENHWAVPDVAYFMIVTGESTGRLADMMGKVSNYYQEMHRNIVSNLKAFIEPIMIAFLAIVVGVIILAVIVPMFDIMNQVK